MLTDAVVPVAYAMHASKKRYALLLGAGISVSAGLPTASDASGNMILAIAEGRGEDIERGENNEICLKWFKDTFGEPASFKRLMIELGISEDNRKDGLKKFIYQTDEEGNVLPGIPTDGHRSIARLVNSGEISLIITTNFDTLMEEALREENVPFEVITEESDVKQMSVFPDKCRIFKVNGDFEKGTLRITPEDLKEYPSHVEDYLRRIFGEYGLVICGWSGNYDTHLSEILCSKDITRRYPTFWCLRKDGEIPSGVCQSIMPNGIDIEDADCFFSNLETVIERFSEFKPGITVTIPVAMRKVRDALRDQRPDLILSDLINTETDRVCQELESGSYLPEEGSTVIARDYFGELLKKFETLTGPLAAMTAMIAHYDDGTNAELIADSIERLINIRRPEKRRDVRVVSRESQDIEFNDYLNGILYYPALLVIYSSGIAAVKKGNLGTLEKILIQPKIRKYINSSVERVPYHDDVNIWKAMAREPRDIPGYTGIYSGMQHNSHEYLSQALILFIRDIIPNESAFDGAFDVFEYLYGLSYIYLKPLPAEKIYAPWPPIPLISAAWINAYGYGRKGPYSYSEPVNNYLRDILKKSKGSDFFGGDLNKFERANRTFAKSFGIIAPDTGINPQLRGKVK